METTANALVTQLAPTAIEPTAEISRALPAAAPDEAAAARFAAIMKTPEITQSSPLQAAAPNQEAAQAGTALSRGDRMLATLQGASDNFKNVWSATGSRLQADQALEMREIMAMQLQVTQMAVEYDLLGKAISKSAQNFDQLVRVQ
ncbi:MAG: EscI/YscI/HrpB family type III secretion system inner rod protein [Ottowia sp.]|uniref:EscI/YscI/HrpB family type III secretion system inner rod protein n=1 Tax=unclassified Ottowia TaxID=2645081 RepID=UPI003C2BAB6B